MEYLYTNIEASPDLGQIYIDVSSSGSGMENTSILFCRWDNSDDHLYINFTTALSNDDKDILDQIVENNL